MKSQAGLSTMIIFIAIILVAAMAASVYLVTSNRLQQRALLVGTEAEERVSRGMEFIDVVAIGNLSNQSVQGFEMLVRPLASSTTISENKISLQYSSPTAGDAASALSRNVEAYKVETISASAPFSSHAVFNVDNDDSRKDTVYYGNGSDFDLNSFANDDVLFLQTSYGAGAVINLSTVALGATVPFYNRSDDQVYAYVTRNASNVFTFANANATCLWDTQIREHKYCISQVKGNDNIFLDKGEVWKIQFRLTEENYVWEEDSVEFRLITDKGHIAEVRVVIPSVLENDDTTIWP